ncbi:UNVERIFIED_CONTAM: Retrovirus-related Pol polyprotein from transposon TNT 1-94 [Sesamum calycinum]|uniref:Retrovirus-related Pol polyprotein from transposon TNT 1-94 n=1 Tax=Sesamum calycinum TaxID=2727403 RepID=A0AAW2R6C9_9LAMI
MTQKADKLYDLDEHVTFTSKDVLFHEVIFPYATKSSTTPPSHPLPVVPVYCDNLTPDSSTDFSIAPTPSTTLEHHSSSSHPDTSPGIIPTSFPPQNTSPPLRRSNKEPRSYVEAAKHPEWREAMEQLDVNNAFLHGNLDEDLHMSPPEGYQVAPGLVCKLEQSLYGLKQTSRQWNVELTVKLQEYGFSQSAHDHYLFTLSTVSGLLALLVYVDDILITEPSLTYLQSVKSYLHNLFTIKDIGNARYFLGLKIARNSTRIYLAQTKYTQDIIMVTGLQHAKTVSTHFPQGVKISTDSGALLQQPDFYRHLVGRLLYLGFMRPDIFHNIQ